RLLLMSGGRVVAEQPLRIPGRRSQSVSVTRPPEREPDGHSSSLQSPVSQPLLSLRNISFAYRPRLFLSSQKRRQVLSGVNLDVPARTTLALMGASGAGKSTLAQCAALWQRPDSGAIWFDGVDLASLPRPSLRRYRPRIQLVLQDGANALNPN